jgi:hypothetical protein
MPLPGGHGTEAHGHLLGHAHRPPPKPQLEAEAA